ncbi:MAG: hypothetical protein HY289_05405 [Planctomycetes bacterium]|nr:hypothetical protein [Planctomycetota bacterium]
MATKQKPRSRRPATKRKGKAVNLRAQNQRLERELDELRKENRQLKRSLGALICKDDPINMNLVPEDGVSEPSLDQLIKKIERAGK